MGLQRAHVLGHLQQFAAMIETTPGTYVPPTTADFQQVVDTSFGYDADPSMRDDAQDGLDDYELVAEKIKLPITINQYLIPGLTAGAANATQERLLLSVFGATPVVDPGVSTTYGFANAQSMTALSLYRRFQGNSPTWAQQIAGYVTNEFTLAIGGNEKPRYTFTGEAMFDVEVGNTVASTTAGAGTTIPVASPQGRGFDPGGRVSIGAQTNGGVGFTIGVQADALLTVSPAHAGHTSGDVIAPYAPTPTLAGSILGHTMGSMTVDGVAYPIKKAEYKVSKNLEFVNDESGSDHMTDAIIGRRVTMVSATIRARADVVIEMARRKLLTARAMQHIIGPATGRHIRVDAPRVVFFPGATTVGQNGAGEIELRGIALATARGLADSLTLSYR